MNQSMLGTDMSTMVYGASSIGRSSKKEQRSGQKDQSLLALNPHVESFLSFNEGINKLNLTSAVDRN